MGRRRWRNQHSDLPQMDATANAAAWRIGRAIVRGRDAAPRPVERHWYRGLESPAESRSRFACRSSIIKSAPRLRPSIRRKILANCALDTATSPAGSRPSRHGPPSDRQSRSASRAAWSVTSAPPPRARPVWVVASVANQSIWLLEAAARSSPSRPTIAHDEIAGEASAGALMTRTGRADCGDLGTSPVKFSA